MTDHRIGVRYVISPRLVAPTKAARRLHLTLTEFRSHLPSLRRDGFPAACGVTGHFDLKAIDAWLDNRSGVADSEPMTVDDFDKLFDGMLVNGD